MAAAFVAESIALDIDTMKQLVQQELDSLHPFSTESFTSLWADDPDIEMCIKDGCFKGKAGIRAICEEFGSVGPLTMTCKVGEDFNQCYFIEDLNKAACSYSCTTIFLDNPSCISDSLESICLYEWNDDGLLINFLDFFSNAEVAKTLAPCMEVDVLGASRSQEITTEGVASENHSSSSAFYYLSIGVLALIGVVISVEKSKRGYTKIESNNERTHILAA